MGMMEISGSEILRSRMRPVNVEIPPQVEAIIRLFGKRVQAPERVKSRKHAE